VHDQVTHCIALATGGFMLLSFITFAAMMLFGGWMFVAIAPKIRDKKNLFPYPTLTNKKISLFSLIFLLFFYQIPSPKPSQE
jgi:hypothetical protein